MYEEYIGREIIGFKFKGDLGDFTYEMQEMITGKPGTIYDIIYLNSRYLFIVKFYFATSMVTCIIPVEAVLDYFKTVDSIVKKSIFKFINKKIHSNGAK